MPRFRVVFGSIFLLGPLVGIGAAQPLLFFSPTASESRSVAVIGDEISVGGPGAVDVLDVTTGVLVRTLADPDEGDGRVLVHPKVARVGNDLLVEARSEVDVVIYRFDGGTGSLKKTFGPLTGLRALGSRGDDVLVARYAPGVQQVLLLDGATGATLQTFENPGPGGLFGWELATLGDDVVVASPPSAVYVFDTSTGAVTLTLESPTPESFGYDIAVAAGDIFVSNGGSVQEFDGTTGTLVRTYASGIIDRDSLYGEGNVVLINRDRGLDLVDATTGTVLRQVWDPRDYFNGDFGFRGALAVIAGSPVTMLPDRPGGLFGRVVRFCGDQAGCGPCETCGPGGSCIVAPSPSCRGGAGGAPVWRLRLRNVAADTGDRLLFAGPGETSYRANFGVPMQETDPYHPGHDYSLCLFDESGPNPELVFRGKVPVASATACGGPCWSASGSHEPTLRYRNRSATPEGIDRVVLNPLPGAHIVVHGKGSLLSGRPLGLPPLPLPLPLRAQFQVKEGFCWEARFSAASVNGPTVFRAVSDPES
jgi:hypothetical protein